MWESFTLPSSAKLLETFLLQGPFNTTLVTVGTTLLGIASGIVGTFALLRERALVSDALAHATLPGLCAAFIVATFLGVTARSFFVLMLGALCSGVLGILCVQALSSYTRLQEDAAIGVVLSTFFGVGVLLLSVVQYLGTGEEAGVARFIYGQSASLRTSDALLTLLVGGVAATLGILLRKELALLSFNSDYAQTLGWPIARLDLILLALIILVTLVGLQSVGLILVVALLIIPAASARFWTESVNSMLTVAGALGALSGYLGSCLSALLPNLPTGAVIVLSSGFFFLVSFFLAPRRGLIATAWRAALLRLRVIEEHLLREVLEREELNPHGQMTTLRGFYSTASLSTTLFTALKIQLLTEGLFTTMKFPVQLSARGRARAETLLRNHRLWEEYLLHYADFDATHVDRAADMAEHVLSPEMICTIEKNLSTRGISLTSFRRSPHPLFSGVAKPE